MRLSKTLISVSAAIALSGLGAGAAVAADPMAYAGSSTGAFGFMDLKTGVFTSLGNSGQTLAGLAVAKGSIFATSYHTTDGVLFNVNPANGAVTSVGTAAGVDYDDFGSTTSGLYAVSFAAVQDLYSINPSTGAATLVGPTGLGYGSWRGLSTNSGALYFGDGPDLYTLNTTTGAATLVGALGSSAELGVLLTEGGVLYGGDETNYALDTINPATGAATVGPAPSGFPGSFYGLAPYPVPTGGVPEPGVWAVMLMGFGAVGAAVRGRRKQSVATA